MKKIGSPAAPGVVGAKRCVYGVPPAGNANYAWVQHAGFVLANGSMSSNQSGEPRGRGRPGPSLRSG